MGEETQTQKKILLWPDNQNLLREWMVEQGFSEREDEAYIVENSADWEILKQQFEDQSKDLTEEENERRGAAARSSEEEAAGELSEDENKQYWVEATWDNLPFLSRLARDAYTQMGRTQLTFNDVEARMFAEAPVLKVPERFRGGGKKRKRKRKRKTKSKRRCKKCRCKPCLCKKQIHCYKITCGKKRTRGKKRTKKKKKSKSRKRKH